jgi:hypothetical protein
MSFEPVGLARVVVRRLCKFSDCVMVPLICGRGAARELGTDPLLDGSNEVLQIGPLEKGLAVAGIVDLIVLRDHRVDFVGASAHGLSESGSELAGPRRALDPGLVQGFTCDAVRRLSHRWQDEPSASRIILDTLRDRTRAGRMRTCAVRYGRTRSFLASLLVRRGASGASSLNPVRRRRISI